MFKVTVERASAKIEFEAGSISEINGILQQEDTELRKFIVITDELSASNGSQEPATDAPVEGGGPQAPKERKTRGPNKNKSAAEATAPAPMPIPGYTDPPIKLAVAETDAIGRQLVETASVAIDPAPMPAAPAPIPADDGIPEALRRVPAPPALVAAPPAPPAPPAAPPTGVLAGKIIAALDVRKAGTPDNGKSLADWLASCSVVTPGVTYDAAVAALRMTTDDRLKPIAEALEIAA